MFAHPVLSLRDLLGEDYAESVAAANGALGAMDSSACRAILEEKVDFYPEDRQAAVDRLVPRTGERVIEPLREARPGAPTDAFRAASHSHMAPVGAMGLSRLGEDGRLYLIGKSEHYHAPLGHAFPGYRLIENARRAGIPNATHNNTRGHIVRTVERELIREANGLSPSDDQRLDEILHSRGKHVLNRVINLETGSLAVEAGVKMMLNRFYRLDAGKPLPPFAGRTPVFLVMGDAEGGPEANYHGTTILVQTMRGMWPELSSGMERWFKTVPVAINDIDDFARKMDIYNRPPYKTAGFLHEIVLMNYGGIKLEREYLQAAYRLCDQTDTPTLADEIQSCMWYPGMLLFKRYGLRPDFVALGKGFPGGEYPASKILATAPMDTLNQFGALVTNGQEELAALSYLITMTFARANAEKIGALGSGFESGMRALGGKHPRIVERVEGLGHLSALHFHTLAAAKEFSKRVNDRHIDVSAQTYKANCPPAVLVKPPIVASEATLQYLLDAFARALAEMEE